MDSFDSDRQAPALSERLAADTQRRNRDSLFLLARVRLGNSDRWADVRVRNLSPGGLMAELDNALAIGTAVELELRGVGRVAGQVAWQTEGRAGIAFDTAIDPMKARKSVGGGTRAATYIARPGSSVTARR